MQQQIKPTINIRAFTLVAVAGSWLAGAILASFIFLPIPILLVGIGISIVLIFLYRHDEQERLLLFLICCLLCGAWRYTFALPGNDPQSITLLIGEPLLTVKGIVSDEPRLQTRTRLLVITVESVRNNNAPWEDAHGQLEVQTLSTTLEDPYGANYGDSIEVQGKLLAQWPHSSPGIFASMVFPRVKIDAAGGNPFIAFLYSLRVKLATVLMQSLPQPEAALLIGILLGLRTPALALLASDFSVTGTAHMIAPAGFKVTLLAGLIASSLRGLQKKPAAFQLPAERRNNWRNWFTTLCIIASIAVYTILNGAGPAALRAGIMGIIAVIAPRLGRTYNVYTTLALTALLLDIFDPFILQDISFQLSFLGTLGIVMLTSPFQRLLRPLEYLPLGHYIAEIIAVTLAAQVATLPLVALYFQQISFIALPANILTVPLLAPLISLGLLICISGLLFPSLAIICGWSAWPVLWYVQRCIEWCANIPGAYVSVNTLPDSITWGYYLLLALIVCLLLKKWPALLQTTYTQISVSRLATRTFYILQVSLAVLSIASTGIAALAFQQGDGSLSITFLDVAPAGQPSQGEAILIRTPDGKSALIDGGLDASSLSQLLDSRLPSWQRSLNLVILTTPLADHITGLQDIISRYNIDTVADGGMLHPNTTYTRWRRTISERNLSYVALSQGMTVPLGTQVVFQVLWPGIPLHKGSNEQRDNGLIIRMVTPGLRILFLGASVQSQFALTGLTESIPSNLLQAEIVQVVREMSKQTPNELTTVLQEAHPTLLVITPGALRAAQRKASASVTALPPEFLAPTQQSWQIVQTAELGTLEITSTANSWSMNGS